MSTTTIRIDDSLKQRVAAAADRAGKSQHAFIIDAIAETVELAEMEDELHRIADERWGQILSPGETVPWSEATAYITALGKGEGAKKSRGKKQGPARDA